MAKYDDASWHYGGDFPNDLPKENGATHIGMFLTWCIDTDLISEFQIEESKEDIEKVKNREMTGVQFLIDNCDEKFTEEDLNDLGNEFAKDYYKDDTNFGEKFGKYIDDYSKIFDEKAEKLGFEYKTLFHVENTFENYQILKPVIDKRFNEWKKYHNIKSIVEIWLAEIKKIVPETSEYFTLKGGVTVEEIAQLEKELQVQFPENFKNFYGLHDTFGHAVTTAFLFVTPNYEGYDLLPFEQIEEEYESIIDLASEFENDRDANYGSIEIPKEINISGYTNPKWIPFAHDHQGNYLLIDLDPSETGAFGQIVELENESWERRLVANSLEELIENQIKLLKENKHKGYEFIKEQLNKGVEKDDLLSEEEKSVVEDIKFKVFSGLFSDEETLEFSKEIAEDEGVEFSDSEIKKHIQKYRSEQHLLLEESNDVIRLKKALKNLKEQFHIISPPIIGYTQDESIYEVIQEIENLKESGFQSNGYVYFTEQDIERVIDEENLFYLGHGKVISAEGVDVKVADIVVEELKRQGFKVSWNGNDDTRICIENFRWVCEDYFNDELLEKYDFNIDNLKSSNESYSGTSQGDTSLTKENFKTLFGEHLIPDGLQKLFNFGEEYGHYEYSENFYLEISDKTGLKTYSEKDEFINAFIEFAVANGTGSTYAIWIINEDLNQCPIVIFGDEGGMYVVAKNINQLLHLLTLDHEPYVSLDSFDNNISFYIEEDDEDYEHSENHDKYVEWVKDNFGLTLITSAEEAEAIIRNAQDKYQAKLEEFFVRSLKDESTPTKQLDLSKIKTVPFEEVKKYIPEDSWYFNFASSNQEKMWKNVHFIEGDWEIENIDLCSPFIKYDNREKDLELYERQDSSGLFLVTGNLKAKNIYALDDGGAFGLIVLGSVEVENMLVGGSEIHILKDLNVKDLFWGSYNHGGLRVGGNISARVFMVSDEYSFEYDKKKMETEFYLDDQEEEFDDDPKRMVEIANELFEPELLQFQLDTIDDDDYEEIYSWENILNRDSVLENLQKGKSVLKSEFDYGKKEKASKTDKMKFLEEYLTTQDQDFFSDNFCDDNDIDDIAMWIDWREEDDNIITYCEDILQTEELTVETLDAENERGFDTIITYKNQKISIPYKGDGADRDTTIKTLNQIIRSEFEIRLCKESLVFDTLCFIPLTNGQWGELDEKYPKQISDKFEKITTETKFYLDDQKEEFDYGKKEKKEVEEIPEIFLNKSFSNKETFHDQFANFQKLMTYFRNEEWFTFEFKIPEINASLFIGRVDGAKLNDLIIIKINKDTNDFSQGDKFMIWRQKKETGFKTIFKKLEYDYTDVDGKPLFVFLYQNESKGINDYRIAFELIKVEALQKIWDLILTTIEKGIYYKAKFEAEVQPETISSLLELQMVKEKYPNSWNDADQCPWFGSLCYSFNQKNENGYESIKIVREIPNINDDFDAQSYYYHYNTNLKKVELDYLANYHELSDPLYEMYYSRRSTNVPFYDYHLYQEAINCWKKAIVVLPKENKNYLELKRLVKNDEKKELKRIENLKKKIFQKPFETMVFEGHTFKVIDIHEAHSIIGELTDFQGKKIYDVYGDDWRFPTYEDNPFFLLAEEEVALEKFEMEYSTDENPDIFILGFIFKKSLMIKDHITASEIDNSPALIVLGKVEAKNIFLFGNVFYFGEGVTCKSLMGSYNHGELFVKGETIASLIYADDMHMHFHQFKNVDAVVSKERIEISLNSRLAKEDGGEIFVENYVPNTHSLEEVIADKFFAKDEEGVNVLSEDFFSEEVFDTDLDIVDENKIKINYETNYKEILFSWFNEMISILEESGEKIIDASDEYYDCYFEHFNDQYQFYYRIKSFNIRMRAIVEGNDFEKNWLVLEYLDENDNTKYQWSGKMGDTFFEMLCVLNGMKECNRKIQLNLEN